MIQHFVGVLPTGVIQSKISLMEGQPTPDDGLVYYEVSESFDAANHHVVAGVFVVGRLDLRTLSEVKRDQVSLMRIKREQVITAGFTWDGSPFDSDATAQSRLQGLFIESSQAGFTEETWRLADNSWRTLDAADAAGVWAALKNHVKDCFIIFAAREASILDASTVEAVQAINW